MDINFHYFAVKTLASRAGFSEDDAQLVAEYSQFVDDYSVYRSLWLEEVPEYARSLAVKLPVGWYFRTVATGFHSLTGMVRLTKLKNQKELTVPFHFIPKQQLNAADLPRENWRTAPARMDTPSLMQSLMQGARNLYRQNASRENLMRIGMLLHTFADTYAHQNFSGFHGWENFCKFVKPSSNIDGTDLGTRLNIRKYENVYAIGHSEASTVPDLTYVSFSVFMKRNEDDPYTYQYKRNNTWEFTIAAREIINYLCDCTGGPRLTENEWNAFSPMLVNGLLTAARDLPTLRARWKELFPEYSYSYQKAFSDSLEGCDISDETVPDFIPDMIPSSRLCDDFFLYNVLAYQIRCAVNGIPVQTQISDTQFFAEAELLKKQISRKEKVV